MIEKLTLLNLPQQNYSITSFESFNDNLCVVYMAFCVTRVLFILDVSFEGTLV